MAIYRNKYTLEFDDIIEGEFNDYKLEINKKVVETTTNNVTIGATNNSGETINQFDPVRVVSGEVVRSKASVSSSMPSTGIATIAISSGTTTSNGILVSGVVEGVSSQVIGYDYYVGVNGGTTNTAPTGTNIVQKIAVQVANNSVAILDVIQELVGSGNPIKLTYQGDDILKPIRASYLDIEFVKVNDSDNYDDLFLAENDRFKVLLYKNNNIFWKGWVGSQYISEPYISAPYNITIKAYDGLHLLKELNYITQEECARFITTPNPSNQIDRWGYQQFNRVIEKVLYFTGLTDISNHIYYAVSMKSTNQTGFSDFDRFNRIHHHTYLVKEGESKTMTKVLEDILTGLGLILYQRDAKWCIVKPSDLTLTNTKNDCIKTYSWVHESTSQQSYSTSLRNTQVSSSFYSDDITYKQIERPANMTLQFPLKKVTITDESDNNGLIATFGLDEIIDTSNNGFNDWTSNDASATEVVVFKYSDLNIPIEGQSDYQSYMEIDLESSGAVVNGKYNDPHLLNGDDKLNITTNNSLPAFKLKFKIRVLALSITSGDILRVLISPKLTRISTGDVYHYYIKEGTSRIEDAWLTPAQAAADTSYTMNYIEFEGTNSVNRWKEFEIFFKPSFTDINVQLPLYGSFAVMKSSGGGASQAQNPPYSFYFDVTYSDIELTALPSNPTSGFQAISSYKTVDYIVESSSNYNFVENKTVNFGSKISNTGGNRLIAFDDDITNSTYSLFLANTDQPLKSWLNWSDGVYSDKTLQMHLAMSHMYFYHKPVRRIEGVHYGNMKYGDLLVVDNGINGSKGKFFPLKVVFNLKKARVNFTGDDLLDNSSLDLSNFTTKIRYKGEKTSHIETIT